MSPEVGCFLKPHDTVLYEFAGPTLGHLQFSKQNNGIHRKNLNVKWKRLNWGVAMIFDHSFLCLQLIGYY